MKRICVRVTDDEFRQTVRTVLQMHERNPHLKMSVNKIMRALLLDWLTQVKESNERAMYPPGIPREPPKRK